MLPFSNSTVLRSTLAGQTGVTGSTDGTGSAATFSGPSGIAVDSTGNIYVSDTLNHTIRKVTAAGAVTTIAGTAGASTEPVVLRRAQPARARPPDTSTRIAAHGKRDEGVASP